VIMFASKVTETQATCFFSSSINAFQYRFW